MSLRIAFSFSPIPTLKVMVGRPDLSLTSWFRVMRFAGFGSISPNPPSRTTHGPGWLSAALRSAPKPSAARSQFGRPAPPW